MRRKRIVFLACLLFFVVSGLCILGQFSGNKSATERIAQAEAPDRLQDLPLQDGDLIFHTSLSGQSKAIQLASRSPYSHCGIIYSLKGRYFVFEAIQPVSLTPLEKWIARGKDGHYVVKRLKNAQKVLSPEVLDKMTKIAQGFMGKSYDLYFEWSDDRIYCSELIWKVYQRAAGIEIGQLERLSDFDLSHPAVKSKLKERYGKRIPMDERVISPKAIYESPLLTTVVERNRQGLSIHSPA